MRHAARGRARARGGGGGGAAERCPLVVQKKSGLEKEGGWLRGGAIPCVLAKDAALLVPTKREQSQDCVGHVCDP